ncbi:MAG: thioesterase family protein [Verrucomicrobiota bacterium]|jgi:acyl-CoA thioester hydrolase
MDAIYQFDFKVPETAVDANRHVNNVAYVQWMQEAAMGHSEAAGCTRMTRAGGATWVVRTHRIEYLSPAFAGEMLRVQTWVAGLRKVRSLRRYKFIRVADGTVLAQGETDWVFVDAVTGRPRAIPAEIREAFQVAPDMK